MTNHYIISVQDSINDYREVQGGYVDCESREDAVSYFTNSNPWRKYFGDGRYQITMKTNADVLQWPSNTDEG